MKTELANCSFLANKWWANRIELDQIAAMPNLDRELHVARQVRLKSEQDNIEYILGLERSNASLGDEKSALSPAE